jgi:hypothetical protein
VDKFFDVISNIFPSNSAGASYDFKWTKVDKTSWGNIPPFIGLEFYNMDGVSVDFADGQHICCILWFHLYCFFSPSFPPFLLCCFLFFIILYFYFLMCTDTQFWTAGKGVNCRLHNHATNNFAEVHACIVNGTAGGMEVMRNMDTPEDIDNVPESLLHKLPGINKASLSLPLYFPISPPLPLPTLPVFMLFF